MFWQMKFREDGLSIHGVTGASQLPDRNASHGCIRVSVESARWLNQEFVEPGRTRVVVLEY
jgi:lipoprotein-anchoring transpeptidase ErfK/SrfK